MAEEKDGASDATPTPSSDDLIVVSTENGHDYDPLFYDWSRPGASPADDSPTEGIQPSES